MSHKPCNKDISYDSLGLVLLLTELHRHAHDMMHTDLNPCVVTRQNHEARDSSVKHCSGSRRITSCAWSHAHDMMQVFFDCILHGCRRLISLQNMAHATMYLLVDIRCVRMYDSLLIISCTLVHPHDTVCVCLVHSCAKARMTLYFFQTQNMTMIVLWVDPLLQNNPDYNSKTKNNIMEQT